MATTLVSAPTTRQAMEALGLNTLRGQTVRITGYVGIGYVEVPTFTATVEATDFYFDRIVFVEVRHPEQGRLTVSIERVLLLR